MKTGKITWTDDHGNEETFDLGIDYDTQAGFTNFMSRIPGLMFKDAVHCIMRVIEENVPEDKHWDAAAVYMKELLDSQRIPYNEHDLKMVMRVALHNVLPAGWLAHDALGGYVAGPDGLLKKVEDAREYVPAKKFEATGDSVTSGGKSIEVTGRVLTPEEIDSVTR